MFLVLRPNALERRVLVGFFFFFKQKTAYEILAGLEFRRVLFRSKLLRPVLSRLTSDFGGLVGVWDCAAALERLHPRDQTSGGRVGVILVGKLVGVGIQVVELPLAALVLYVLALGGGGGGTGVDRTDTRVGR